MRQNQISHFHRIYTFGSLQIHGADTLLVLKGEKTRNLLAYLVLHPRIQHRRETLADMLWPDASPERVRRNLSDVLYRLQKTIEPEWLTIDTDTIMLQPKTDLWVDVWEFDRLVASKDDDDLRKAIELYAGDLLSEIYDDWILAERELRRSQFLSALETLSQQCEAQGKLQQALLHIRQLILIEPLHEHAHQHYLRILGRLQRFSEALAHYDYLCALLKSELNSKPMKETDSIIQSLLGERDLENAPIVVGEARPFVGRKSERVTSLAVVETMLQGIGGILTIEGEAGIGKSRLLREIAAGARWRGATVLYGQASETPGASPFLPLVEALTPLLASLHGKQLEASLAGETLAILAPLNPAWKIKDASNDIPPEQAGRRFYNALVRFGEILAGLDHVVLALDDLHWATPVLWECMRALEMGFVRNGGLLILAYRRPAIEKLAGWETIQTWNRDGLLKAITLEPLDADDVAQFVGETSNVNPAEIRLWTGGNPFFISEWLAEPNLERPNNRRAISLRLRSLSPTALSALESASILGESIPYRLWTELSGFSALHLASISDELMNHYWLQPSSAGYAFAHDLIRNAVYDSIEPIRRRTLHERAAHALATLDPDNLRARAFHLDQAGLIAEAAKVYRLAGEQDLSRFAFREAQNALDRALTLMSGSPTIERVETALILAQICNATGDRVRQESVSDEALAGARGSDPHLLQALLISGRFFTQTGQVDKAEIHLESALDLAIRLQDRARETETLLLLAELARERSRWNQARGYYTQALEIARAISDRSHEARALKGIGYSYSGQGAPQDSIPWIEQSISIYRAIGDFWRMAHTQVGLMGSLLEASLWDKALTTINEAIPVLDAYGDRPNVAVARHNQAWAYISLGEHNKARQNLEKNLYVFESIRSRRALSSTQFSLGEIAENEGDDNEAISRYRLALANAESVNSLEEKAYALYALGTLSLKLERPDDAISFLESSLSLWVDQENAWEQKRTESALGLALLSVGERARAAELAEKGWSDFQVHTSLGEKPQEWMWMLYRLLKALDQPELAREILFAAYSEIQRQAQNIRDENFRHGFFERVLVNRAIVCAHDELVDAPRVMSARLARKNIPLGRSLREDEYVRVQWTLSAPEDESIADKSARRHYRLKRLLDEAEKQDAAPTDDDLAQALDVSRRTILRDMQVLVKEIPRTPTRKRKR